MQKITATLLAWKGLWKKEGYFWCIAILIGVSVSLCYGIWLKQRVDPALSLAQKVVRFHVLANSDSDADQELKLAVRDRVLEYLRVTLASSNSKEETLQTLDCLQQQICMTAAEEIQRQGYDYPVAVSLVWENFPERTYGQYTFPAGFYDALRIEIGAAEGKNWWCVLYPQMCMVDAVWGYDTEESQTLLKNTLSREEYLLICETREQTQPKISFASAKWLGKDDD